MVNIGHGVLPPVWLQTSDDLAFIAVSEEMGHEKS